MRNIFQRKTKHSFVSPTKGKLIELEAVQDEVFSKGMMGSGFAIQPTIGEVYAPVDGEVVFTFPTKHAIGIKTKNDMEVLIHIGLDTVEMNGEGFVAHVEQGTQVKQGDLLIQFDQNKIREAQKDDVCIILFPNNENVQLRNVNEMIEQGETCFTIG